MQVGLLSSVDLNQADVYIPRIPLIVVPLENFCRMKVGTAMKLHSLSASDRTAACDLCQATSYRLVGTKDRRGDELETVICETCGLVSHQRIPTDSELNEYYAAEYRQDYHGEYLPSPHRVVRAWEGANWLYDHLAHYLPPASKVFEIGAGIGCTVKRFELGGFQSEGIEPGVGFSEFARNQLYAQVRPDWLFDLNLNSPQDLILLVHVIEHFQSPRHALETIHQFLKPDGLLYVECPNVAGPHAAPGKQFHFAHIYNFAPHTLEMLAQSCGYTIEQRIPVDGELTLRYLFRRSDTSNLQLQPQFAQTTLDGMFRYNTLSYHLRPAYWGKRMLRDIRFARQRLTARTQLQQILQQCRQAKSTLRHAA